MVSIVVPVYYAGDSIVSCLQSTSMQIFNDFEILVLDDGSRDNIVSICNSYMCIEPRLRVISEDNSGVSIARNRGIMEAYGE